MKLAREEYLFKLDDLFWQPAKQLAGVGNHLPLIISNAKKILCKILLDILVFWCPSNSIIFMYSLIKSMFADSPLSTRKCLTFLFAY